MSERTCSIDGCIGTYRARGWCNAHWLKWRRFGDPLASGMGPSQLARIRRDREEIESGVRKCDACGEIKPLGEYGKRKKVRNGLFATCNPCRKAYTQKMYRRRAERDPEKLHRNHRSTHLRLKYGMSAEEYDALFDAQRGRCKVCGTVKMPWEPGHGVKGMPQFLVVDHDHETGHIRGLICNPCNLALGFAEDSIKRLEQLRAYLLAHKGRIF